MLGPIHEKKKKMGILYHFNVGCNGNIYIYISCFLRSVRRLDLMDHFSRSEIFLLNNKLI